MTDLQAALEIFGKHLRGWAEGVLAAGWNWLLPFIPWIAAVACVVAVLALAGIILLHIRRDHLFHGVSMAAVDRMDGTAFEAFLTELFRHLGYHVEPVGRSHDFGADLVLTSRRGQRIVVQAKRYSGSVGIAAVQEVVGAVHYYRGVRGMVVTNSSFTESAEQLAARSGVELWGRARLAAAMRSTGSSVRMPERRNA